MAVDIEHAGAVAETLDDVGVPDLVEQGARLVPVIIPVAAGLCGTY
jgi:hypothetical protein